MGSPVDFGLMTDGADTEMTGDDRLHRLFLEQVDAVRESAA